MVAQWRLIRELPSPIFIKSRSTLTKRNNIRPEPEKGRKVVWGTVQKHFMKSKKRSKHYKQIAKADRATRCDNQKEVSKCQRNKNYDYKFNHFKRKERGSDTASVWTSWRGIFEGPKTIIAVPYSRSLIKNGSLPLASLSLSISQVFLV